MLKDFFIKHKDILNVNQIEIALELSQGTISKAISGMRKDIPLKHHYKIKKYLEELKEDINF